jgi:hypothetical protein
MGRPPKLTPQQQKKARRQRAEGASLKPSFPSSFYFTPLIIHCFLPKSFSNVAM